MAQSCAANVQIGQETAKTNNKTKEVRYGGNKHNSADEGRNKSN